MGSVLDKRQLFGEDDPNQEYLNTAFAVKWAVLGGLFFLLLLWFGGGYYHAQRRMKRDLPPLRYHKWLVSYEQRKRFEPALENQFSFYRAEERGGYNMGSFPPPGNSCCPPKYRGVLINQVYDPNQVRPPAYQMPQEASKVDPAQDYDSPPSNPPPRGEFPQILQQNGAFKSPPIARSTRSTWARKLNPFN